MRARVCAFQRMHKTILLLYLLFDIPHKICKRMSNDLSVLFFMLAAVTLWCIAEWHLTFWWIRSISVWPLDMLMFVYMLGHVDNATDGSPWRGFVSLPTQKYVNDKLLTRRRVHSQCVGGTDCEFKMAKWQRLRLEYIILIMARVISKYKIGCI